MDNSSYQHSAHKPALGASLYVPSIHKDLLAIANGDKMGHLRSVIFCTEDAIAERDLSYALFNLSLALQNMAEESDTLRFVRVRNADILGRVLLMPGAHKLAGFVLPKTTRHNFDHYFSQVRHTQHLLMPTLETAEVFDDEEMKLFCRQLNVPQVRHRILALRIGGNDLLALLGLRRPTSGTIYQTPLGQVIARLVTTFRPHGFALTAPVFEHLSQHAWLDAEVAQDMAHGMIAKTAIHPDQVPHIERHYQVAQADIELALRIIDPDSPAVFRMQESMCEVATHSNWAQRIIEQARLFGIRHAGDTMTADHTMNPPVPNIQHISHIPITDQGEIRP
ncbi:HpcH/HpaI aldolase/citrate lyase family protein [Janthinobacterium agaricidamnosum]|uniref:HpcH/HpaI aldolase/citrate lyase family protein n=1 Tax=Janthinobacterium agaricidamnosum NBRC 102515 = DSM 9628 TaxID=1349767 RepID=W0V9D8_9BURK|nr:HpcH/HpaI aldolase/citrate lyase family protein [Janthinobacterium agaricidamnosum]CDG84486.1 hpcH/HpaI aldolase/citrate lyase family protein [Janthinobacterium agaricidamnosum NBRC 102515 = DSM 9628]